MRYTPTSWLHLLGNLSLLLLLATPVTAAQSQPPSADVAPPATCQGIELRPGVDLQGALDAAGSGATLCFQPGTYRLSAPLRPLARQTLQGLPGAVLSGSQQLMAWEPGGPGWVARGALPTQSPTLAGTCMPGYSGCRYPHDLFYDHRPLTRVTSLSDLGPGRFYADYAANAVYLADDPAGHLVELGRAPAAIVAHAAGVTIRGLTVEQFAPNAQDGAIFVDGADSVVELCEVRLNHAIGIKGLGTRITVRNNYVHHNGQLGVSGTQLVAGLFEGNELAYNNYAGFYNFDGESGGAKWTRSSVTVRGNSSHHNKGVGLWVDIDSRGVVLEGNRATDNDSDGVRVEISYDVVVRNNTIGGNGFVVARERGDDSIWTGGGIAVHTVTNIEITGNQLDNNLNGIVLRKSDRGSGLHGLRDLRGANVHHNQVRMPQGQTGMIYHDDPGIYAGRGNCFQANSYQLASDRQFVWKNDTVSTSQWRSYGNDQGGAFSPLTAQPGPAAQAAAGPYRLYLASVSAAATSQCS